MNIDDLTLSQLKDILTMAKNYQFLVGDNHKQNPMVGKRCLIRTYSAGVHIGDVVSINEMEVVLKNALRLWKWEGGGLSLSAVANNGIKGGRLNYTGDIMLTNAIEIIPTTVEAEETYVKSSIFWRCLYRLPSVFKFGHFSSFVCEIKFYQKNKFCIN